MFLAFSVYFLRIPVIPWIWREVGFDLLSPIYLLWVLGVVVVALYRRSSLHQDAMTVSVALGAVQIFQKRHHLGNSRSLGNKNKMLMFVLIWISLHYSPLGDLLVIAIHFYFEIVIQTKHA